MCSISSFWTLPNWLLQSTNSIVYNDFEIKLLWSVIWSLLFVQLDLYTFTCVFKIWDEKYGRENLKSDFSKVRVNSRNFQWKKNDGKLKLLLSSWTIR